jgi:SAM-dependent methyltransferase
MSTLKDLYNAKHKKEVWVPLQLKPTAVSTHRFDDVARLSAGIRGKVLDIGCGAGHLLVGLADLYGKQFDKLVGVDLADVRIDNGNRAIRDLYPQYNGLIELRTGDADKPLPFGDAEFDLVICCAVVEHVVDVFGMIKEVARVCKSEGGHVIITVPNLGYIKHIARLAQGKIPLTGIDSDSMEEWVKEGWDGGHLHYFTKDSLGMLLNYNGLSAQAWTSDGKFAKFRRWSRLLSGNLTVLARKNGKRQCPSLSV